GEENMFLFGPTPDRGDQTRGRNGPNWHYANDPERRPAFDLLPPGHFNPDEPGRFAPFLDGLIPKGDFYMHLADLKSYSEAHDRLGRFYLDPSRWADAAIINVASSGKFSSDRTIAQYASEIWTVTPCPVGESSKAAGGIA